MEQNKEKLNNDSLLRGGNIVHLIYPLGNEFITFRSSIQNLTEQQIHLEILKNSPPFNIFKVGDQVILLFLNDNEIYKYVSRTTILEFNEKISTIKTAKPADLEIGLRRRSYRCEVNLPFSFYCCRTQYSGRVFNLSETGLWAAITEKPTKLKVGETLLAGITFPIANTQPVLFDGKVIRLQEPYQNFPLGLALSFEKLKSEDQKLIIKYIFQRQRELLSEMSE